MVGGSSGDGDVNMNKDSVDDVDDRLEHTGKSRSNSYTA